MRLAAIPRTTAFSLVEVALALGIAAFCLVTVIGLVPLGIDTGQTASNQTTASGILTHVLADLRATPQGVTTTAIYAVPIPANTAAAPDPTVRYFGGSEQQFSPSQTPETSRFRLTVSFPASAGGRTATLATLLITWPAQTDPATGIPAGRVQFCAALDRN